MILRKPYAFFIKYFKLLHAIIALFIVFLLYKSFTVYNFFNAYIDDYSSALTSLSPRTIINIYSFFAILFIIILTIILLSVMFYKKKPKLLYIYSLIVYIAILVLFGIAYPTLRDISSAILDVRVSKAFRDFYMISLIIQALALILFIVRATGFDIKQFDFGTDLQKLDIDEKDSEEIEVSLEFDKNKFRREVKKNIRNLKYLYAENSFVVNTMGSILFIILAFTIYFNLTVYTATYDQGTSFEASGIGVNVVNTYVVQDNPKGVSLTDKVIVAIKLQVKKISSETLNTGLVTLKIGNISYSQDNTFAKELYDLGEAYIDQKLGDEYQGYILTYLISKNKINEKMVLKFNDNVSYVKGEVGAKNIFVNLKTTDLTSGKKTYENKLGEQQDYDDSVLSSSSLKIDGFEINNKFKNGYKFCYGTNKCIDSYEYVTPSATGNYVKTLLKINGSFILDADLNSDELNDLTSFMNAFATINYKVGNTWKSQKVNSQVINFSMSNDGAYYIEVPYDITSASEIKFVFKIRNCEYKYILK